MVFGRAPEMISAEQALPGRDTPIEVPTTHFVTGRPIVPPWPEDHALIAFGMGCFWGAERLYWPLEGVYTTFVGYAGGFTPNPTYPEVCTGRTGHAEVAVVVFDPAVIGLEELFAPFWENHDPTQVNRQGNDVGTQYRSTVLTTTDEQAAAATASRERYQHKLFDHGFAEIATTVGPLEQLYWAEPEHQQYLAKHPGGYCNHGFCQVAY